MNMWFVFGCWFPVKKIYIVFPNFRKEFGIVELWLGPPSGASINTQHWETFAVPEYLLHFSFFIFITIVNLSPFAC